METWRRRLPHWVPEESILAVTWRLAGSTPLPPPEFLTANRTTPSPVSGPIWLANPKIAAMVVEALHYGETNRGFYELYAYVIMPNHVHVVWKPKTHLPKIMHWIKGATGRRANSILGLTGNSFWQQEYYDHWIRDGKELEDAIAYLENNPVKSRFVNRPEDWLFSSAGSKTAHTTASIEQMLD